MPASRIAPPSRALPLQSPNTHRLYLFILALVLLAASLLGSWMVEKEGHRAIWRNTVHTSEMMSSLFADQVKEAIDKLQLIFEMVKDEPKLLSALAAGNHQVLEVHSRDIAARSNGLLAGFHYFALDGRLLFGDHDGDAIVQTKAVQAAMKSGQLVHSLEVHSDNDVHIHLAGAVPRGDKPVAYLNLATTLNEHLDDINRLLRLETEQHAEEGHRGDSAIGIFLSEDAAAGGIRPVVTTETFPRSQLTLVNELIARQITQGETQDYQFSLAPIEDGMGKRVATLVLALDVKTAAEANHAHSLSFLLVFLLASTLIVIVTHVFMTRSARREFTRRMELERLVEERTADLRRAEQDLRDQNANLETLVGERTASLAEALVKAEAATRAKSEFLANMSHEIRTPMNAVIGLSSLCLQENLPAKARDYVAKTHGAANQLLGIINDILDISKVEAGKLRVEKIAFRLDEVIENVANINALAAAKKQIELIIDLAPATPEMVTGDPLRLTQVLNNLINNALKFTERGSVVLKVQATDAGDGISFAVSDTGIGLDTTQIDRLFSAFTQVDTSSTRRYGGTGLGLVISQRLVALMGGNIAVSSTPGQGSRFSFTLDMGRVEAAAASAAATSAQPLRGKKIRLVEAHPEVARIIAELLAGWGAELVDEFMVDRPCDLLIAGSGPEARAALAAATGACPVIALVAADQGGSAPSALISPLSRPVTRASFGPLVRRLIGAVNAGNALDALAPQHPAGEPPRIAAPDFSGRSVLLVDDNELNQLVGRDLLAMTGVLVGIAGNGLEAVEATSRQRWDVVLMDIQMPIMDGLAATLAIRQQPQNRDLPIIAMTAHALDEERQRCLAAGMSGFITKPVSPVELYRLLQAFIAPQSVLPDDPPAAGLVAPAAPPAADDAACRFDPAAAIAAIPHGSIELRRVLELFLDNHRNTAQTLRQYVAADLPAPAGDVAHSLKGSAHYAGAGALIDLAARTEAAIKAHQDGWQDLVLQLAAGLDNMIREMAAYRRQLPD